METKQKKNKKIILISAIVVVLCILVVVVIAAMSGSSDRKLAEQLELGQRYLSELDYDKAIAAYEAAIRINPKCEDAYLGLADVYVAMGEVEKAVEILAEGYEQTESGRIARRQEELTQLLADSEGSEGNSAGGRSG